MTEEVKTTPAEKPSNKIQVSWGPFGKILKEQFDCFPQPLVAGGFEAVLLNKQEQLLDLMSFLKTKHNFPVLLLINAVEYKESIQLIYQLQRVQPEPLMLCIKVNISKSNPEVQTLTSLWGSADWYERELWDLQGIKFVGHPDLKRILNPDNWEGFPLRKYYIPPVDALNGPITAVKGKDISVLAHSVRSDVEVIQEPNKAE
jgi:NADH:ubiquinone oxidoreductase subunit C